MILIQVGSLNTSCGATGFWKMSFLHFRRARFSAIMPSWKDARLRFLTSSGVGWGVSRFPYVATSSANSACRITLSFTNTSTILFTNFSFRFKYCQTHPTNHVMHNDPINQRFLNLSQLRSSNNKARKKNLYLNSTVIALLYHLQCLNVHWLQITRSTHNHRIRWWKRNIDYSGIGQKWVFSDTRL